MTKSRPAFMQARAGLIVGALLLLASLLSLCKRPYTVLPTQAVEAAHAVEKIEIEYEHIGWGSIEERYLIESQGGGFAMAADYVRRRTLYNQVDVRVTRAVSTAKVQRLLDALDAPARPRKQGLRAAARAMSSKALAQTVDENAEWWKHRCTGHRQERYTRQLTKGGATYRLLDGYYDSLPWTDDYPAINVRVHRKGRAVVTLHSHVQQALMLPWQRDGVETWDPRISDGLAMLLPMESQAYGRLSRRSLAVGVAGEAVQELKELCGGACAKPVASPYVALTTHDFGVAAPGQPVRI